MIKSHLHEVRTINVVLSVNISSRTAIAHLVAQFHWQHASVSFLPYGALGLLKDEALKTVIVVTIISSLTHHWAYSKMRCLKHSRLLVVYSPLGLFKNEMLKTLTTVMIISSLLSTGLIQRRGA